MNKIISDKLNDLIEICKKYKVKSIYAFGSVCTDKFKENSDIDFLITFDNIDLDDYADNYFDLYYSLKSLFNREIDMISEKSLSNPYFILSINKSKQLLYAA